MTDELVLALDASTTACKALAFDQAGRVRVEARAPIDLRHPSAGAWEQDAEQWWTAALAAIRSLTAELGVKTAALRAMCVTHQRETFVVADEQGRPLRPALTWMDTRCRSDVERAVGALGFGRLHELSGKPPCTTPSFYKLLGLLRTEPELAAGPVRPLDVHAFLAWRLTGRYATSLGSADPLGLVDMRSRAWAPELCELAGLTPAALPELLAPGALLGTMLPTVAASCGLPAGLPLVAGLGDGQAAALGAGIVGPRVAYLNLGTAIVCGVTVPDYRHALGYRTLFGGVPGSYLLESDLQGGTYTLDWLCERLLGWKLDGEPDQRRPAPAVLAQLEREASGLAPGAEGLLLVPYWNGVMDPYWDADAAGVVLGWSGAHGPPHLYRAVLEGIALEERLKLQGLEQGAGPIVELVVLGGGARSALWCQILADVLGRPVVRAATAEATALGAAMLAAVGVGWHADLATAIAAMSHRGERFEPGSAQPLYDSLYREIYEGLYRSLRERLGRLGELRRRAEAVSVASPGRRSP